MTFKKLGGDRRRDIVFSAVVLAATLLLAALPSSFASPLAAGASERVKAAVVAVDDSLVKSTGPVKHGEQQLRIRILSGRFRGTEIETHNLLIGKMELDKLFAVGDRAFVVLDLSADRSSIAYANVLDHYRLDATLVLMGAFALCLVAFAGWTGVKALLSFFFSGVALIKLFLPAVLRGYDPVWMGLAVVAVLTAVIIFLVGGFTRKGAVAFAGAIGGVAMTAILAAVFTRAFHIHGAVRPFTETLIYSGFDHLDLGGLFVAGVFLASSGAVMDLGMDIAAAMHEIAEKNPRIGRAELVKSGFFVGRHVVGTMTTTLLLAYTGGYTALLMTFIAQGVPFENVVNMIYVSAEFVHTMVGSFGLVLVAPITALAGGAVLAGGRRPADPGASF